MPTQAPGVLPRTGHVGRAALDRVPADDLFALFVDAASEYAVFRLDPIGIVVGWNPGAERISGYSAPEIVGHHCELFYPYEDRAAGRPASDLSVASTEGRLEARAWRVRKDGSHFPAEVILTALRDGPGDLKGFASVTRDESSRLTDDVPTASDERRERVGEELADTVVRRLYAAGLGLQGLLSVIEMPAIRSRMEAVIDELDLTIGDVRTAILDLQR